MKLESDQKHAVVGYGVEGKSTAQFLKAHGVTPSVLDKNSVEATGFEARAGNQWLDDIDQFDVVWRSPSVDPELLPSEKTTSQTQHFLENCQAQVIGVTATKGKGTICSLIAALLRSDGYEVWLIGNIGLPALDVLDEINNSDVEKKIVVYEMSSFQLWDVTKSPQTAVIGMIAQDHLDIHHSLADYHAAKARITKFQTPSDRLVFNAQNQESKELAGESNAGTVESYNQTETSHFDEQAIYFEQQVISRDHIKLLGDHNVENICAALSVAWPLIEDEGIIKKTLASFEPLEHRMEALPAKNKINYINDSYSSNPSSTLGAVASIKNPVILLLGGVDRAQDYQLAAQNLSEMTQLKACVTYGQNAELWSEALSKARVSHTISKADSFHEVIETADKQARTGDTILLSPGSPSHDMFDNFTDRGNQFKQLVAEL